jgi:hypothetical protein
MEVHLGGQDAAPVMQELLRAERLDIERFDDVIYVFLRDGSTFDEKLVEKLAERVVFRRANLEDVFLKLTGRGLSGDPVPGYTPPSARAEPRPGASTRAEFDQEEFKRVWAEMDELAAEISEQWPDGVSAVDAVREQRR